MSLGYFLKQTVGQSYKTQMEDGSIIVARWQQEKSILYDKQVKSGIGGHFHCNFPIAMGNRLKSESRTKKG